MSSRFETFNKNKNNTTYSEGGVGDDRGRN